MSGRTAGLLPGHRSHPGRRPKFRSGLVVARDGDALLIEGGPSSQLLTGAAASVTLPRLLPLLDGRRDREEVCAELSLSATQFDRATKVLDQCGLLEWVRPADTGGFAAEHVAAYYSRSVSITQSCLSAADLARDLSAATILIFAPPLLAAPVTADLAETGVGTITTVPAAEAAGFRPDGAVPSAAVVFDDPARPGELDPLLTAFGRAGIPVLRCSATAQYAEVGPVFHGLDTACAGCFRRGRDERDPGGGGASGLPGAFTTDVAVTQVLASLVTSELLSVLTGQAAPSPPRQLTRITLPGPVVESYEVVPDPECAVCVGGTPPTDEETTMVLGYEWRVRKVTLSAERAEAPTPAKQAFLASLQRQRDAFPGFPSRQLPEPPGPRRPGAADHRRVDEPAVAGILARTAGFRGPGNSRWAPSGGNMGSVAVYLVTDRDLFGLPGTIFRYLDTGHEVVSVQRDPVALADFLEGTDLDPSRTAVVIALVGEAGRLSQKYEDFAWRLTHLDSGCAALQLHLAAACYGLSATFAARWPARLGEMLELERRSEVVTAVAGLEVNEALPEGDPRCR